MNIFYLLPDDILRDIFHFDPTYSQYFSKKIIPIIPYHCLRKEDHLLFRANEMMETQVSQYSVWFVNDTSIDLIRTETYYHTTTGTYSLSFIKKKKIVRFLSLYMTDNDAERYNSEEIIYNTQNHFMSKVLPLLETHKHNHIVMDGDKEYYYRLKFHSNPYLHRLTKNRAVIYNHRDEETDNTEVGIFVGNIPSFFHNESKKMTVIY